MDTQNELRDHLLELLKGESAHISLEAALYDFPVEHINTKVGNSPHTAWQLLEHIRLAQWDILDFCANPNYKEKTFPDDYWPKDEGTSENWRDSVKQTLDDLQKMRDLISNESTGLFQPIQHGSGQTILREALLIADHNAYHLGQLVLLRRMINSET